MNGSVALVTTWWWSLDDVVVVWVFDRSSVQGARLNAALNKQAQRINGEYRYSLLNEVDDRLDNGDNERHMGIV